MLGKPHVCNNYSTYVYSVLTLYIIWQVALSIIYEYIFGIVVNKNSKDLERYSSPVSFFFFFCQLTVSFFILHKCVCFRETKDMKF